jgi:hypothetical protein
MSELLRCTAKFGTHRTRSTARTKLLARLVFHLILATTIHCQTKQKAAPARVQLFVVETITLLTKSNHSLNLLVL